MYVVLFCHIVFTSLHVNSFTKIFEIHVKGKPTVSHLPIGMCTFKVITDFIVVYLRRQNLHSLNLLDFCMFCLDSVYVTFIDESKSYPSLQYF